MKRILIVEDEAAIREFEAINLKRVGYNVEEAGSGEEALDIYDNDLQGFDIALLDISMPGMDGFALCKELRSRSENLGIIMLTARTQEMDKISGLMLGADDYITKPFSLAVLRARVNARLRSVSARKMPDYKSAFWQVCRWKASGIHLPSHSKAFLPVRRQHD